MSVISVNIRICLSNLNKIECVFHICIKYNMFVFSYILAFAAGQRPALNLVPVGGSFATLGYCTRFACLTSLIPYIQYISQLFPLSHILNTIYPIHLIYPIYPRLFNPEKTAQIRTTVNKYIYPIYPIHPLSLIRCPLSLIP